MAAVNHRRRSWGALLGFAPWDGKPRPAEPLVAPVTTAALAPAVAPGRLHLPRARQLLRVGFGRMLATAPWDCPPDPLTVTPNCPLTQTLLPGGRP